MTKQLDAMLLAEILMHLPAADAQGHAYLSQAADELRRLHRENQAFLAVLEFAAAQQATSKESRKGKK